VQTETVESVQHRSRFPLAAQIVVGMGLALMFGPFLGGVEPLLNELARMVIQVIKGVATPLLFLSIVAAIAHAELTPGAGFRLVGFAVTNTCIALTIGLGLSNVFQPGKVLESALRTSGGSVPTEYAGKKIDFVKTLTGYVPTDLVGPFATNTVIGVVILAVMFGLGIRAVRRTSPELPGLGSITDLVAALLKITEWVLHGAIRLVPLAVFCSLSRTIAQYGYAPLAGLGVYVVIVLLGLGLHVLLTFQGWLVLYARASLREFWRAARDPVVYALGTNSSLATLPLTLHALSQLRVSKTASALGACVGTNLNNDGIVLYEGLAMLFVAQAMGIELSLGEQILAAFSCVVAAMGVAGIPEAGFVSLALVLNTVGLSVELLPLLLGVDWVIARARSATNVLSDMVLSILVDRSLSAASKRAT
jgi:Na+/H+-dicarboxylate symporter